MNTVSKIQKLPKQPLAAIAYETIVRKIICLEYQPSQHLEESQLVEDLGIGRTPIREALVRLHGITLPMNNGCDVAVRQDRYICPRALRLQHGQNVL